jgi:ankyrin repeat protein
MQEGMTALHHAAGKGYVQVVDLLLQHKAKPNIVCQVLFFIDQLQHLP